MERLPILAIILSLSFHWSSGLNCFDCAYTADPSCNDPFNVDQHQDSSGECGDRQTHCVKFKTVNYLQDSGFITGKARETVVVTRMCIRRDGQKNGCRYFESDAGFYFECLCDTDDCNSGCSLGPNFSFLFMAALIVFFLWK